MNSIQLKLCKKMPFLFDKSLHRMANGYANYQYFFPKEENDEEEQNKLYELLEDSLCDERILSYLENKYRVFFRYDDMTPEFLKRNRNYINHIMRYDVSVIFKMPEEMVNDNDVLIFFEAWKKYSNTIYLSVPFPKIFLKYPEIIDLYINCNTLNLSSDIIKVIDLLSSNDKYLEKFLSTCCIAGGPDDGKRKVFPYEYKKLSENARGNEKIIRFFVLSDFYQFDFVPEDKKDFARNLILQKIRSGEEIVLEDSFSIDDSKCHIFKDKEISMALLQNYFYQVVKKYNMEKDDKVVFPYQFDYKNYYNITKTNGISFSNSDIKRLVSQIISNDFELKDDEMDFILFIFSSIRGIDFSTKEQFFKSKEWLLTCIRNMKNENDFIESKNRYTSTNRFKLTRPSGNLCSFDKTLFDNETIDSIIAFLADKKLGEHFDLIRKLNDNLYFFNKYLEMLKSKNDVSDSCIAYFDNGVYNEEIFLDVYEVVKRDPNGFFIPSHPWDHVSSSFLKMAILNNKVEFFDKVSGSNYDKDLLNLLYRNKNVSFIDFINFISDKKRIVNELEFQNVAEYEEALKTGMENLDTHDFAPTFLLMVLQKYKKSNLTSEYIDSSINDVVTSIKEKMNEKYSKNSMYINNLVDKMVNGSRNVNTLFYISSDKSLYWAATGSDVSDYNTREYLDTIPIDVLEKINKKQINDIYKMLKNLDVQDYNSVKLAINIYLSIGYERARDLLRDSAKHYGEVNESKLLKIFENINPYNVEFVNAGKGYVPVLNEGWINLLFGNNYKVLNTPIRNYLNDYSDKEKEIVKKKDQIKKDLTLTESEKEEQISLLDEVLEKYRSQVDELFSIAGQVFNEWDIVEEEFFKAKNKSSLNIKLNLSKVLEIMKIVKSKRNMPELELRDQPLIDSDVFEYVGVDNQYVSNSETVKTRAVELSRGMDNISTKKFPDVSLEIGGLKLSVYNPRDREILAAGIKSGCCFRPNGNADDSGKNSSLLYYCTNTEYGGGIKITNENGEMVMFSPILRNGNVLMIHSIESKNPKLCGREVHELLVKFAEEVIRISKEAGDPIDFVTISNLHYLNLQYIEGSLPKNKKFYVFDKNGSYANMYNNLSSEHMVLAHRNGVTFNDIKYGAVDYDYKYEITRIKNYYSISLENKDLVIKAQKMDMIKKQIVILSTKKQELLKSGESDETYGVAMEIKNLKKEYLRLYNELLSLEKGKDFFADYKRLQSILEKVTSANFHRIPSDIMSASYGNDWFIVITNDGKLVADYLPEAYEDCMKYYENLKSYYPELECYQNGIPRSKKPIKL